jgi:hypothetical protein
VLSHVDDQHQELFADEFAGVANEEVVESTIANVGLCRRVRGCDLLERGLDELVLLEVAIDDVNWLEPSDREGGECRIF